MAQKPGACKVKNVEKTRKELIKEIHALKSEISELKEKEQSLINSVDFLNKVINSIADPIFIKDHNYRWILVNNAYCRLVRLKREELSGKSDYDFYKKNEADVFREKDELVLKSGEENINEEFFTDPSGKLHIIRTKKTLYIDKEGNRFIAGIINDITSEKEAKDSLKKAYGELEEKIEERTGELLRTNKELTEQIKERLTAEKSLRESEEKYRSIFNNIRDTYYEASLDGTILEVSPSIQEISSYKREELLGKSLYEIYANPEDRKKVIEKIQITGRLTDYEVLLKDKNNDLKCCALNSILIKDPEGRPLKIIGSMRNVDERKKIEESLKNRISIEKLVSNISRRFINLTRYEIDKEIIETLKSIGEFLQVDRCYINILSDDGKKISYGYEWCAEGIKDRIEHFTDIPVNKFKWFFDNLKDSEYLHISNVENLPEEAVVVKELYRSYGIKSTLSIPLYLRNRFIGYFGLNSEKMEKTLKKEDINLIKLTGDIFVNVLERKRIEEEQDRFQKELIKTQKMEAIGVLAGGIAHDFNNILASIMGYTEMSLRQVERNSKVWSNLNFSLKSINRAKDLIEQILTYSRQTKEELRPIKLIPIFKESVKFIRATLPATIEIRQKTSAKKDVILGNSTQIYQIIMNLCTNAFHSMNEREGLLNIELVEETIKDTMIYPGIIPGNYIKLIIKDTGHGMDEAIKNKIFDPFFTTKKRGKGTGMGLSVVHGIVKNHKGFILVSSEPKKGSTFQIFFPSCDGKIKTIEQITQEVSPGNESILFIDDEKILANAITKMLASTGYKVMRETSSLNALEIFKKNPENFDLVITDLTMPRMSGLKLVEEIKTVRKNIPVILCTGYSDEIKPDEIKKLGIERLLKKPVSISKMTSAIRDIMDKKG